MYLNTQCRVVKPAYHCTLLTCFFTLQTTVINKSQKWFTNFSCACWQAMGMQNELAYHRDAKSEKTDGGYVRWCLAVIIFF